MNAIVDRAGETQRNGVAPTTWEERLKWGLTSFEPVELQHLFQPLSRYLALLLKWNQTYNLTAVRDPVEIVSTHLLDSLAVVPHLPGIRILDVGTGPGLPGIPLAMAFPARQFTLIDSIEKKTTFLRQAVAELGLTNVTVICDRVERWHPQAPRQGTPSKGFDSIISRAYAELALFVDSTEHLLARHGTFVAMKGRYPSEEIQRLASGIAITRTVELHVPGLNAERHLIFMERV